MNPKAENMNPRWLLYHRTTNDPKNWHYFHFIRFYESMYEKEFNTNYISDNFTDYISDKIDKGILPNY